jgi:hypothetical protein
MHSLWLRLVARRDLRNFPGANPNEKVWVCARQSAESEFSATSGEAEVIEDGRFGDTNKGRGRVRGRGSINKSFECP